MRLRKASATWAVIALLASAGTLAAHHSLVRFDTSAPIRVKGSVVRFDRINPHSRILVEHETEDGHVERWLVDGPAVGQLFDRGIQEDFVKPGDVVEFCGFESLQSRETFREASRDAASPLPERFMNGNLLIMPDGAKWFWSDYGHIQQCLGPGDAETLVRRAPGR